MALRWLHATISNSRKHFNKVQWNKREENKRRKKNQSKKMTDQKSYLIRRYLLYISYVQFINLIE